MSKDVEIIRELQTKSRIPDSAQKFKGEPMAEYFNLNNQRRGKVGEKAVSGHFMSKGDTVEEVNSGCDLLVEQASRTIKSEIKTSFVRDNGDVWFNQVRPLSDKWNCLHLVAVAPTGLVIVEAPRSKFSRYIGKDLIGLSVKQGHVGTEQLLQVKGRLDVLMREFDVIYDGR